MKKKIGIVRVSCVHDNCNMSGVNITLLNSSSVVVQQKFTDSKGRATLLVNDSGYYRIRAQACSEYSPIRQSRWVYLTACNTPNYIFSFCKLKNVQNTGTIEIIIRDANYPEYLLDKGEITLWRGLK
ncbi:MAG: hypothetical protein WAX04_11895 [Oscillospiraceae bacterium]